jgi:hypothetical protein
MSVPTLELTSEIMQNLPSTGGTASGRSPDHERGLAPDIDPVTIDTGEGAPLPREL